MSLTQPAQNLVLVQFETGNFRFAAYAWSEVIGRKMLRQAWATHVAQTGADPDYLDEFYDDVNVFEVKVPGVLRDGSPIATHEVDDAPTVEEIVDFATMHVRVGHSIGPGLTDFNMDEVAALLHYHLGIPAYVEYTGGGCATIYAGKKRQVDGESFEDGTPVLRYPGLGGPGWFTGPMGEPRTTTFGSWNEFYVGSEEQADADPMPSIADLGVTNTRQIAALIALYVIDAADFDNVTAIGLDATQRGIPQNGA